MEVTLAEILQTKDPYQKYKLLIDYISHYLENEVKIYNLCDFKENKCIANRLGKSLANENGCCYQYKKGLCKYLQNKKCSIDSISCKLFICKYLEKQVGKIDLNKLLPVKKILNHKQREILKRSFFKDKKEVIELLMANNK